MPKARARIPDTLEDLLKKEWEEVIEQACLGVEDELIAKLYLLDAMPQIDIAEELANHFDKSYDRSTISRRMPKILGRIERTARKLGKIT